MAKTKLNMLIRNTAVTGLDGAVCTAVGAAVRDHNVYNEALNVLVGGVITGAIAGLVRRALPDVNSGSNCCLRLTTRVMHSALSFAATLTAPLIGELCLKNGEEWGTTAKDTLIGRVIVAGGVAALAAAVYEGACGQRASKGLLFFSNAINSKEKDTDATLSASLCDKALKQH